MLAGMRVHPTVPAQDLDRARKFYSEKLGLEPSEELPGGLVYGSRPENWFILFPSTGTASGAHTQMGFSVDDIDSVVAGLKERGLEFIEYDLPSLKTEAGIAQAGPNRVAWFNDSEGNLVFIRSGKESMSGTIQFGE